MNQELVQSFVEQINRTHGESLGCDPEIEKWELLKCNKVREVGILLLDLKGQVGRGNFIKLLDDKSETHFAFGKRMAQNYMQFARLHPGEFKTWDEAHKAIRNLPTAIESDGHGAQTRSMLSWLDRVGTLTLRCVGFITGSLEKRQLNIDSMPPDERLRLKNSLKPANDLYEQL